MPVVICYACTHGAISHGSELTLIVACCYVGLQGQNQVLGMGDTGIDTDHCMFADSSYPITASAFAADSSGVLVYSNPAHRKIRYYRAFVDEVDINGHGTHCAGSAVGSLQTSGEQTGRLRNHSLLAVQHALLSCCQSCMEARCMALLQDTMFLCLTMSSALTCTPAYICLDD